MARRAQRESFGGAVTGRQSSNDSVRAILSRHEQRLRRIGANRTKADMKRAYREAADRLRRVIPR